MPLAHYHLEGKTALIALDDGKANALSEAMIAELLEVLTRAENEASAIVLTGRPERFCGGFDLKVMMSGPQAAKELLRRGADLLMRLYGTPLPLVIACTGHAMAAGALMLLTGDLRIGTAGPFRIGLNEVSIGIPVPVLAMGLARDRLVTTELVRATLRSTIYTPDEAARAGFLDEVVPPGDLLERAKADASKLGEFSRMAFRGTKERLRRKTIDRILATLDADMDAIEAGS